MKGVLDGRRVLVILNPTSGRARPERASMVVQKALERVGAVATVQVSDASDEPARLAAAAAEAGYDVVIAAGGDGTVTAVASGLLTTPSPLPMGIVPLGTGNGLARVLRLPIDPAGAIAALQGGHIVALDVVKVDTPTPYALFFLGAGLDAEIMADADTEAKTRLGYLAYLRATLRRLQHRRTHRFEVVLDGQRERFAAHTVTLFNAGQFRLAGLELGPPVDPHDGRLDVAIIRSNNPWRSAAVMLRLATGQPRTFVRSATTFRIDATPPLLVHVDGDVVGSTPLVGEVVPRALPCIAAADYPFA
jgi:YegS/Rv2252/BmrU family lipid kinase